MEKPEPVMDLFDYITDRGPLSEQESRDFFGQVLTMVEDCLAAGIVHCDIKDENLLVNLRSRRLFLVDFGAATRLEQKCNYDNFHGTRAFCPPEMIRREDFTWEALTTWSLGSLLFDMVCGVVPYTNDEQILRGRLNFKNINISSECRHLIRWCLEPRADKRATMADIRSHPWLTGLANSGPDNGNSSGDSSGSDSEELPRCI